MPTKTRKLTAKQFLAKYPEVSENTNCLLNMGCSVCGERDRFLVELVTQAEMLDSGSEASYDEEWDEKSPCSCSECHRQATVGWFRINGLDELIKFKLQNNE